MKTWIEDAEDMEKILERALVGRLGLAADAEPYVVPLNYVYDNGRIYFHTGLEGRKLEIMQKNPRVCFEVDEPLEVVPHEQGCLFTMYYRSVILWGTVRILDDNAEKMTAIKLLLAKYGAGKEYESPPEHALAIVTVCEITVEEMTGKANLPDETPG